MLILQCLKCYAVIIIKEDDLGHEKQDFKKHPINPYIKVTEPLTVCAEGSC